MPCLAGLVEAMMVELAAKIAYARAEFGADYAGRIYSCTACNSLDAACAPRDELPDDYPCPECFRPQTPLTPIGEPARPNRAARRAAGVR